MSYIAPISPHGNDTALDVAKPALVYLASQPTEEETGQILNVTRAGVVLTGTAAVGMIGPVVGKMDISESEDSYLFRESLPGVAKENLKCDVAPNGHLLIKGVITTGEKTVYGNNMKFEMPMPTG